MVAKDLVSNRLIVAQGNDHPALFCREMKTSEMFWINDAPAMPCGLQVKIRYRQPDQLCEVETMADGCRIRFDQPQRAVTPGQWACFYDGDICLGGGIIVETDARI